MVNIGNHNVIRYNENDTSFFEVSFFLIKGAYNEINHYNSNEGSPNR